MLRFFFYFLFGNFLNTFEAGRMLQEEDWDTPEAWQNTFQNHDNILNNYNMMHDSDDLIEDLAVPGTNMDKNYPFYFNTKLDK